MRYCTVLKSLVIMLAVCLIATTANARPGGGSITTDGAYLYVLCGETVHQYTAGQTIELVASVEIDLPEHPEFEEEDSRTSLISRFRSRPGGSGGDNGGPKGHGGSGICTDGVYLYVLAGNTIQQYLSEDMTLVTSVELPESEESETEEE